MLYHVSSRTGWQKYSDKEVLVVRTVEKQSNIAKITYVEEFDASGELEHKACSNVPAVPPAIRNYESSAPTPQDLKGSGNNTTYDNRQIVQSETETEILHWTNTVFWRVLHYLSVCYNAISKRLFAQKYQPSPSFNPGRVLGLTMSLRLYAQQVILAAYHY